MSIVGILFKDKNVIIGKKDATAVDLGIGGIVVDAAISEEHVRAADVTENPVEDGAKITDHVQIKPAELTIDGIISDTPIAHGYPFKAAYQNSKDTVGILLGKASRSIDAYNRLVQLMEKREPFVVVTGLKQYRNMILFSLTVPRKSDNGGAINFRAQMKEIRIVSSNSSVKNVKKAVKTISSKTKNLGDKVTQTVPSKDPSSSTPSGKKETGGPSILFNAGKKFGIFK